MRPNVPDLLSIMRLVLSFGLFFLTPFTYGFLALYLICCVTDLIDGPIARRTGTCTPHGQSLDSIADAVLGVILLIRIVPAVPWENWMIWWIAAVAVIRLVSLGIGTGRFGKPAFVHTYLNKAAGFLLYTSPFTLMFFSTPLVVFVTCGVATVSGLEYLYANCTEEVLDRDLTTVFRPRQ